MRSDERNIKSLEGIKHPVAKILHRALSGLKDENIRQKDSEGKWVDHIENERIRLLNNDEPLVDGSKNQEGLYDGDKTIREACGVSRDFKSAFFLYLFTRLLKPDSVIELGTNVGISSAYIAAGLQDSKSDGQLVTLDASPYRQEIAKKVHDNVGLQNIQYEQGLFYDALEPALKRMGKIDLAFIDGHHQYQPTLDYFEEIACNTDSEVVFIFDDIRYSKGMKRAWKKLQVDKRFSLVVDLNNIGICVYSKTINNKSLRIPRIYNALS